MFRFFCRAACTSWECTVPRLPWFQLRYDYVTFIVRSGRFRTTDSVRVEQTYVRKDFTSRGDKPFRCTLLSVGPPRSHVRPLILHLALFTSAPHTRTHRARNCPGFRLVPCNGVIVFLRSTVVQTIQHHQELARYVCAYRVVLPHKFGSSYVQVTIHIPVTTTRHSSMLTRVLHRSTDAWCTWQL